MSDNFIPGIASQSLGAPGHHGIREKLEAAAAAGLKAVEIFEEDLQNLFEKAFEDERVLDLRFRPMPAGHHYEDSGAGNELKLGCARQIRQWCQTYGLKIICLQPFKCFEGLVDPNRRKTRLQDLKYWLRIAEHLGTDLIQIPSNFLSAEACTGDRDAIVADLRTAADMGQAYSHKTRFSYEALCFGTHVDTWDAAWDLVEAVDRPNFGTCIDTFNLVGRVYGDPTSADGVNPNAQADMALTVQKMRDVFSDPAKLQKIFYVELCDGERLEVPIGPDHPWYNANQLPRMTWSRNARLFPFETDGGLYPNVGPGYLPILQILDALLDVGYRGYMSFEVFSRTLHEKGHDVVLQHAHRAKVSWERCAKYIDNYLKDKPRQMELEKPNPGYMAGWTDAGTQSPKSGLRRQEVVDESTREDTEMRDVRGGGGLDLASLQSRL